MRNLESATLPPLPSELYSDLAQLDPRSHEFKQNFEAANELARSTGHAALTLEHIFPPVALTPPEGFKSHTVYPNGAELPVEQFENSIYSLQTNQDVIRADAHELTLDSGQTVRYVDLRDFMTASVRKDGPENERDREALDRGFYRDLKFFVETGHAKNSVVGVKGVNYTKLKRSVMRSYWRPVTDKQASGVPTVVRLADSRGKASEGALYRRVFHKEL